MVKHVRPFVQLAGVCVPALLLHYNGQCAVCVSYLYSDNDKDDNSNSSLVRCVKTYVRLYVQRG